MILEHAHQNLSALYLLLGNFEKGWREYRWFWNLSGPYDHLQKPMWDGFDLRGKTLLLHAGAGFGDTIQFIRYAPLIKERGANVLVGCKREIASLLKSVDGIDGIIIEGEPIPHFDVQSSMFRLPIIFETAVAHLAGALGKPVWTLLPFVPGWRWLLDRDDSPWYPTMRLFRQPSPGDWNSVVSRVNEEMRRRASEKCCQC